MCIARHLDLFRLIESVCDMGLTNKAINGKIR
jgi:hypothetical protein